MPSTRAVGCPIYQWVGGVAVEAAARQQLDNLSKLPFIYPHLAVMPDVHAGKGATVGTVIPTQHAVIPAAVGVDIGCGMMALKTTLQAGDLPDQLGPLRSAIEAAVPHGRSHDGGVNDRGAWRQSPEAVDGAWSTLVADFNQLTAQHPRLLKTNHRSHLGTLGGGNHFIEVCLDESQFVWLMLHSGSRGVGNAIGSHFIALAKDDMRRHQQHLPDQDLAYLQEGSAHYQDYWLAVDWAQRYARLNRELMMAATIAAVRQTIAKPFETPVAAVNCHHNYVQKEVHFGQSLHITRKGAVSARAGELGIIPGSMGARSYIVRGRGNPLSFHSCSHGAGRQMSRTEAKRRFTVDDHIAATVGVECRKGADVLDETPMAYKDIDAVMKAQADLVEVLHTLKQVVCIKG